MASGLLVRGYRCAALQSGAADEHVPDHRGVRVSPVAPLVMLSGAIEAAARCRNPLSLEVSRKLDPVLWFWTSRRPGTREHAWSYALPEHHTRNIRRPLYAVGSNGPGPLRQRPGPRLMGETERRYR
jgi:hypothetical protein